MSIKPLPRKVNYTERDKRTRTRGKVIDVEFVNESFEWGDFRKEAQIIQWENGKKAIRFGYYVKDHRAPENEYAWGSQTTLIINANNAEKFLRKALKLVQRNSKSRKHRRLISHSS